MDRTPKELLACPICCSSSLKVCEKPGKLLNQQFELFECISCTFLFIANPSTDYSTIYNAAYYEGNGADPMVDYAFEFDAPDQTIRKYEWAGLHKLVSELAGRSAKLTWLDYGCGAGGFVRYLAKTGVVGFGTDTGGYADKVVAAGIPFLPEQKLREYAGKFDVITLIEVIEHVPDPVALLKEVNSLLRPGGVLFLTTGNSEPHRSMICEWPYIIPDIHISLFNPKSMRTALSAAGFTPRNSKPNSWTDIIKFKVLKNLGARRASFVYELMPWSLIALLVDRKYHVSALPYGVKP